MSEYKNITGTVTRIDENGSGFITPKTAVGAHIKDIFFSADTLGGTLAWSELSLGLEVEMSTVFSKNGGLYAGQVTLPSMPAESTEKWREEIMDTIGVTRYERLKEYFYTKNVAPYEKSIKDLKDKHWQDTRNLCLFFALIIFLFFFYDSTNRDYSSPEEKPEKSDYSPYSGWNYE